jgi:hypothetical protein
MILPCPGAITSVARYTVYCLQVLFLDIFVTNCFTGWVRNLEIFANVSKFTVKS